MVNNSTGLSLVPLLRGRLRFLRSYGENMSASRLRRGLSLTYPVRGKRTIPFEQLVTLGLRIKVLERLGLGGHILAQDMSHAEKRQIFQS